jgi:DNA-binding XRE family transcriptional regulator
VTDRQILRVIGENVRRARLQANLTQECLAEIIGAHWQTINYIERGKNPCSIIKFARICQALEVSPNRLLDGLPEPDRKQIQTIKKIMARKRPPKQA